MLSPKHGLEGCTMKQVRKKNNCFARRTRFAWLLAAPVLLYILVILLVPCLWGVFISFGERKVGQPMEFNGLGNYISLMKDKEFWNALWATVKFTTSAVVLKVVIGTGMALLLNMKLKGRSFFRSVLMLPWTLPILIATLTWKWLLSDVGGIFSYWLSQMGVVDRGFSFLSSSSMAMFAVVLVNVWKGAPFIGTSVLSGLQTIPQELYEAAEIDGAGTIAKFIHITLPLVKPTLMLSTVLTTIWTLNNFEGVWLLTGGGPAGSTQVLPIYTYLTAMSDNNLGRAMAVSILSMPILILLINSVAKRTFSDEGGDGE